MKTRKPLAILLFGILGIGFVASAGADDRGFHFGSRLQKLLGWGAWAGRTA